MSDRDCFDFIHAADIHLDSPMRGLSRYEGAPVERMENCTRQAFRNLVDQAIDERVQFLIIAGDLYDGDWPDFNTGLFFIGEMGRLGEAGIRVVLLDGNHDAANVMTRSLELPANVHRFDSAQPTTIEFDDLGVALHGQSFETPETTDNLARGYPEPIPGRFNIGVLHTALEGDSQHATYAPCSLAELVARGYDYWALGHVHRAQVLHRDPYVVFPGNLQGRHIRETGAKGASRVSVRDGVIEAVTHVPCDVMRWRVLEVDATGVDSVSHLIERIAGALENALEEADGRVLAARVAVTGRPDCYPEVARDRERFVAEVRGAAVARAGDRAWIERVRLDIEPPAEADARQRRDAIGELAQLLDEAGADRDLAERIRSEFETLVARLPAELRQDPELEMVRQLAAGRLDGCLDELGSYLIARVTEDEG